jgi:hypothetical protein
MRHRLLLYLPLAACSLPTQEAPQIARFALAASREGAASRPASGPILLVRPFHSGPQCAQRLTARLCTEIEQAVRGAIR